MLARRSLIIFAALISLSTNSGAQPQPQTAQAQKATKAEKLGSDDLPLSVKIIPAKDAEKKADEDEKNRKEKAYGDRWLTYATIWLAAVTTLLACFTGALWLATYRLVSNAKETAKRQLRAYIYVGGDKGPILDAHDGPEIHMFLKNAGQTPAYDLTHWFSVGILEYPLKKEPPIPGVKLIKTVVQPGVDLKFVNKLGRPLDAKTISQLKEGTEWRLYIWGEIIYRDAFNHTQFTKFRLMHGGPESQPDALIYCEEGNDAT